MILLFIDIFLGTICTILYQLCHPNYLQKWCHHHNQEQDISITISELKAPSQVSCLFLLVKCVIELRAKNWDVTHLTCHLCLSKVFNVFFEMTFARTIHNNINKTASKSSYFDSGEAFGLGRAPGKLQKRLKSPSVEIASASWDQVSKVDKKLKILLQMHLR